MKDYLKQGIRNLLKVFGFNIGKTKSDTHEFDDTFTRLQLMRGLGFYPATICDIGASNGRWTRKCIQVFPRARYFCVDPLDENQPQLARFKAEQPNISYWQGCLGSESSTVSMNVDGSGSSILPGHVGNPYGVQKEVRIETLDNLILYGICPQPDMIKLDVQGYELEVLKGATSALSKAQAIIAEVSFIPFQGGMPVLHEVVGQLAKYGFVLYDILSLKLRPLDRAAGQSDLLFLMEMHPLRISNKWDHDSVY